MFRSETPIFTFRGPMGVPVEVSGSIIFLALIFVGIGAINTAEMIQGMGVFACLVMSIFCHEFGHAWGAKVQGIKVDKVVLHGGGGYCLHASTNRIGTEFIVMMGPLVNLALWSVSSLIGYYLLQSIPFGQIAADNLPPEARAALTWKFEAFMWLDMFARINLILFVLNLVPVQPLDGGKLLHLGLLRVLPGEIALRVAGAIGLVFAVLWVPAMLLLYFSVGWMLLFFPAIRVHWMMAKGDIPL
ncbi:MAG: site-2 protease family protein [Aliishimia sp.]